VDFAGWAAWQEDQARVELRALELEDPSQLGEAALAAYGRCHDEITAVARELGLRVEPLDGDDAEVAERLVSFNVAVALICLEPETLEHLRTLGVHEQVEMIAARADAIRSGSVAGKAVKAAEGEAREKLAMLYERHSRGDSGWMAFARDLRRRRFEPSQPSLKLAVSDGGILEIPPDQVHIVEAALRAWRRASRAPDDIADRIAAFLSEHPGETTAGIARGVRVRTSRVSQLLSTDPRFQRVSRGRKHPGNARCWALAPAPSALIPGPGTSTSEWSAQRDVRDGD
jgi:hypothetical protein